MGRRLGRRLPRQRRGPLGHRPHTRGRWRLDAHDTMSIERLPEHPLLRYARALIAAGTTTAAPNRAKDEFVAMLGHDFRNPLSAIVSAVQILERVGTQDDASRHARDVVARQAKNITRMVEDLLEINRIATGKIRLDLQRVELADMVRHCLATLAGRASAHRVSLEAAEVWVDADPVRLEQIVVNLLDNAVKYTPAGGAIHVRVSREGTHAVLRVRDTGVGIEPDVLPRIFDLFVQGEPGAIRAAVPTPSG